MSFWKTSTGDAATDTGTEFETGGGQMDPIPAGTRLKAMVEDAGWSEFGDDRFINIRWTALEPSEYKNRKVFQKVRVYDEDTKKADKAKRMLAAIDANCGSKLAKVDGEPTDADLQSALLNRPMLIEVQVWKISAEQSNDGQEHDGNWVNAVSGGGNGSEKAPEKASSSKSSKDKDDDIPF